MANKEKEVKQKNSYFKEMKAELKKVVWPTPKELVNNTTSVIGFVLIIAVIVFILDFCFDNVNKYGITKLQEKVRTSFQATDDSESNEEGSENQDEEQTDTSSDGTEAIELVDVEDSDNSENTENSNNESNE